MSDKFRGYLAGILVTVAAFLIREDALGLDKYVKSVQDGWVDPIYTVPLAILLILGSIILTNHSDH
jgi:hypothetical protein